MQEKYCQLLAFLISLTIHFNLLGCSPIFKSIEGRGENQNLMVHSPEGPNIENFENKIILPTTYPIERINEPKPSFKSLRHNTIVTITGIELCNNAKLISTQFKHPLRGKSSFPRSQPLTVEAPYPCPESGITLHSIEYPSLNTAMKNSALSLLYEVPVSMGNCDWIAVAYYNPIDGIIAPKEIIQYKPKTTKDFGFPCSTKVLTKNGLRTIDQCYPGTRLICFDFEKQEWVSSLVINIQESTSKKGLIRIKTKNTFADFALDQQVFLFDKQAWVCASDIRIGDLLLQRNQELHGPNFLPIKVTDVEKISDKKICFLELENHENYCIGAEQLLVHNCKFIIQNGTSTQISQTKGSDCLKIVGPAEERLIKTGLLPDNKTVTSFFPCNNLHSYCANGRIYVSRKEYPVAHSDQAQSGKRFDWGAPERKDSSEIKTQKYTRENHKDQACQLNEGSNAEKSFQQINRLSDPCPHSDPTQAVSKFKPEINSPITIGLSGWPQGAKESYINPNTIRYLFGHREPSINQLERFAFFIDDKFEEFSKACNDLKPKFQAWHELSLERSAEAYALNQRPEKIKLAYKEEQNLSREFLYNQEKLFLNGPPLQYVQEKPLMGIIADLTEEEINSAFYNLCLLQQGLPKILETSDSEKLESTLTTVLTEVAYNWEKIKEENPSITARDLILPILAISLFTTLGILSIGYSQLIATLGYQIARHGAPHCLPIGLQLGVDKFLKDRQTLKQILLTAAIGATIVQRTINPGDLLTLGVAMACGAEFTEAVASIFAFNSIFKGATLAINSNLGRAGLSAGKSGIKRLLKQAQTESKTCVNKIQKNLSQTMGRVEQVECAMLTDSEIAVEKVIGISEKQAGVNTSEKVLGKADTAGEKQTFCVTTDTKKEIEASTLIENEFLSESSDVTKKIHFSEKIVFSAEVLADKKAMEVIKSANNRIIHIINNAAEKLEMAIPTIFTTPAEKLYWQTWSILKDMPFGGKLINGRWYKNHVLERMAPRTKEVLKELEGRFVNYWKNEVTKNGYDKLQPLEFAKKYKELLEKYVDPRTISPIDIENAICNGKETIGLGSDLGKIFYKTDTIEVILNSAKDVISTIPNRKNDTWRTFKGF